MCRIIDKEKIKELKEQWKKLWLNRFEDKFKAEGIANEDFPSLFVDKGTVIFATRDFKQLDFKQILKLNQGGQEKSFAQPTPAVGGWGKFIRSNITNHSFHSKRNRRIKLKKFNKKTHQQLKKGGHGWLHS